MGFWDRLFGRKDDSDAASVTPQTAIRGVREAEPPQPPDACTPRPFDTIMEAENSWRAGEAERAEKLFARGIGAYRRYEPTGIDFALGRYGAFLIDQDRKDEAAHVLEQAIERRTDIPAIWSDYLGLVADRHDFELFRRAIQRMEETISDSTAAESVLAYARRADRTGATVFAEAVARWVVERATAIGDKEGRWAAIGDLGRILERSNRPAEAVELWRAAFDEGSRDPETANRLSMQIERAKDYAEAIAVIRAALSRGLPANVEEALRKRLARCEDKTGGRKREKHADVPAYSIRRGSTLSDPVFQVRLKPAVKDLELVGQTARCLLASKEGSTLVDIDVTTGSEIHRIENLPLLGDTWFAPDGCGIGIRRTAAIGRGPTLLRFFGADGRITAESSVPDATSQIGLGGDLWYVGCRDGYMYAFGFDGKRRWAWETPGTKDYTDNAYFRPCPYFVTAGPAFAVAASMGNIYAVSPTGETLWHATLPSEKQTRWEFTVPARGSGAGDQDAYRILGLRVDAPQTEVKSAYRRLALATHPDRNPGNEDAAARFRTVQGAYERILAGPRTMGGRHDGVTISIRLQGLGPTASFLAANAAGVAAGSSQGGLYVFDQRGRLREARVLGDGPVRAALRSDGTLGAAWCSDALLFVRGNTIVNAAEAREWPRGLTMLGDDVVLWRSNELRVMDSYGRLLWSADFSKPLTGIATHGDTLVCAAGVLAVFKTNSRS